MDPVLGSHQVEIDKRIEMNSRKKQKTSGKTFISGHEQLLDEEHALPRAEAMMIGRASALVSRAAHGRHAWTAICSAPIIAGRVLRNFVSSADTTLWRRSRLWRAGRLWRTGCFWRTGCLWRTGRLWCFSGRSGNFSCFRRTRRLTWARMLLLRRNRSLCSDRRSCCDWRSRDDRSRRSRGLRRYSFRCWSLGCWIRSWSRPTGNPRDISAINENFTKAITDIAVGGTSVSGSNVGIHP